jgi:hypothetical protein
VTYDIVCGRNLDDRVHLDSEGKCACKYHVASVCAVERMLGEPVLFARSYIYLRTRQMTLGKARAAAIWSWSVAFSSSVYTREGSEVVEKWEVQ